MKILHTTDADFSTHLEKTLQRAEIFGEEVEKTVQTILRDVKEQGDRAVIEYTKKFEKLQLKPSNFGITEEEVTQAFDSIGDECIQSLTLAAKRIERFHKKQIQNSWITTEEEGTILGQMVRPIERVGIYVPGGKASYPSSVLMNAIPAKVAGVKEIVMVTPPQSGGISPYVLAAARIAGVKSLFRIGGAQAIAALAYGTESIPKVDKIVGPGNVYVSCAKKMVFGTVGIDMIAGPSEVLILADGSGSPTYAASDILSQAEHDEMAASFLVTDSLDFGKKVRDEVYRQLESLERKETARASIEKSGVVIITKDINESIEIANRVAPEHLELAVARPFEILSQVKNAGAIFLGHNTPEALGDYLAGPNHVLPTGGSARFSSPLSVDDFTKKSSVVSFSSKALGRVGGDVIRIAEMEGFDAHARSVRYRMRENKNV